MTGQPEEAAADLEYLWHVHATVSNWLVFSDAKSGAVVAANAIVWGVLFSGEKMPESLFFLLGSTVGALLSFGFVASSLLSVFFALRSIHPTLRIGEKLSHIYFEHVAQLTADTPGEGDRQRIRDGYVRELLALGRNEKGEQLAHQIWANMCIASKKFRNVRRSVKWLYPTLLLASASVLVSLFSRGATASP